MPRYGNSPGRHLSQYLTYFRNRIGAAYRCRSVVPGDSAAKQWQPCINQREMQTTANQVVDENRSPADPQALVRETPQLVRLQMMSQQRTAYDVEGAIAKRQLQSVTANRAHLIAVHVRPHAIQQSHAQRNALPSEQALGSRRKLAVRCTDVQQGQLSTTALARHAPQQVERRPRAPEESIDATQVVERRSYLAGRSQVAVRELWSEFPFHNRNAAQRPSLRNLGSLDVKSLTAVVRNLLRHGSGCPGIRLLTGGTEVP